MEKIFYITKKYAQREKKPMKMKYLMKIGKQ